jgi:hypothetical protein
MDPAWHPRGPNPGPRRLPCRDRRARQPLVQDYLAVKPSEQRVGLYWRSVLGVGHGMRIARHASLGLLLSSPQLTYTSLASYGQSLTWDML